MAQGTTVRIVGLERFTRTLDQAADDLGDMGPTVDKTAQMVAAEARARAPRRSGRLASSIVTGTERNQAIIGSDVVYAGPIHWGWQARGIDPSLFLLDAAEQTQTAWMDLWRDDVQSQLDQVKGA